MQLVNFNFDDFKQLVYKEFTVAQQQEMIARRNQLIKFNVNAPKYLLQPEVITFFSYVDNSNHLILFKTLWNTGGRISEILMLTPDHFQFGLKDCLLVMPNLKQKIKIKKGVYSSQGVKQIRISNKEFLDDIKRYIVTNKIKNNELLFKYTRLQVNYMIGKVQDTALKNGVTFPFKISAHTFRHSFAMNLYYNNTDEKVIQAYLGHSNLRSTHVYTKLFHLEQDISHVKF